MKLARVANNQAVALRDLAEPNCEKTKNKPHHPLPINNWSTLIEQKLIK